MKYILILMLIGRFGDITDVKFFEMPSKETCEANGESAVQYYGTQKMQVQYKCVVDV